MATLNSTGRPRGEDLTGQTFGRLTVEGVGYRNKLGNKVWTCLCVCGNHKNATSGSLIKNNTTSCGCYHKEAASKSATTHGKSKTTEYKIWTAMKKRCNSTDPRVKAYYADRGIKVCERWENFENFLEDMGNRPSPKHSIDRVDGNGNYCPENCRWATDHEQKRNRSDNVVLEFDGKRLCVADWAKETGIGVYTLHNRLKILKWSVEKTLTTPTTRTGKRK